MTTVEVGSGLELSIDDGSGALVVKDGEGVEFLRLPPMRARARDTARRYELAGAGLLWLAAADDDGAVALTLGGRMASDVRGAPSLVDAAGKAVLQGFSLRYFELFASLASIAIRDDDDNAGAASITLSAAASERRLLVGGGTTIRFAFDLAIPSKADPDTEVLVPVKPGERSFVLQCSAKGSDPVAVLSLGAGEPTILWDGLTPKLLTANAELAVFGGRLLAPKPGGGPTNFGAVTLSGSTDRFADSGSGLRALGRGTTPASSLKLSITVTGDATPDTIKATLFGLSFSSGLVLQPEDDDLLDEGTAALSATVDAESWIRDDPDQPFTLVVEDGAPLVVVIDPGNPRMFLKAGARPVARVYVPGVKQPSGPAGDLVELERRFEFEIAGESKADATPRTRFDISPSGLEMSGTPKQREVWLTKTGALAPKAETNPLPSVNTLGGALAVTAGEYLLWVQAEGDLPYFQRARAFLDGTAASRGKLPDLSAGGDASAGLPGALAFRITPDLERRWLDASGLLSLDDPDVWLALIWRGGSQRWEQPSGLSGTMTLRTPEGFEAAAEPWLDKLFADVSLQFAEVELQEFVEIDGERRVNPTGLLPLRMVIGEPLRVEMFSIFTLELSDISIGFESIEITGGLEFERGKVKFAAKMGPLALTFRGGVPRLGPVVDDGEFTFGVEGELDIEGRVTAAVSLQYEKTLNRQLLSGTGSLDVGGMPPMGITFNIGRARLSQHSPYFPLVSMFGTVDYPIQLYQGIVLREYGAGFGVNMALDGLEAGGAIEQNGLEAYVENPEDFPFPEPTDPADWVQDPGRFMLVGRTFVTASRADPDIPQPYVVDAIVTIDQRFDITFMTNLWMFSSLDDAKTESFRQHPAARGALVVYPRNLTTEGHFRTLPAPEFSGALQVVKLAMRDVQGRLSFFASPDRVFVQLGPFDSPMNLGPFEAETTFTIAMEATGDGFKALASIGMRGRRELEASVGFDAGIVAVSAGFRVAARFGVEAVFAGGYKTWPGYGRQLALYARLRMHLSGEISIWLAIKFRIFLLFTTLTISLRWSFRISIAFDASLRAAILGSGDDAGQTAVSGVGNLVVTIMDYELSFSVSFELGEQNLLDSVEGEFAEVLETLLLA